jgi:DNA modification methylase
MAVKTQSVTDRYAIYNGDCCEVIQTLKDESIHFSLYSPPFATINGGCLYNYSSSDRDFSNARTYDEFFEQYAFLVREIHRVTLPGRISAVHCTDIPNAGANICGYSDFPGDIIRLHQSIGFDYLPRRCIWKEPLAVRTRTMAKALTHRQICEDSTKTNCAAADYVLEFRKRGDNPVPVTHDHGLLTYAGEREIPSDLIKYRNWQGKQTGNRYSHWIWRQYASCIWDDIRLNRVLKFNEARDKGDEKHQHPLQMDVIDRYVELYTNRGEIVLEPFMGVGSVVYGAVANGRKGIGMELKPSYYRQAVKNLESVDVPIDEQPDLFAGMAAEEEPDESELETSNIE